MRGFRVNLTGFLANVLRARPCRAIGRNPREAKMVKVQLEVRIGSACFRVSVRAGSMRRAVSLAGVRHPRGEVRLLSPVEPETAFAGAPGGAELFTVAMPASVAG